jgi:putative CocE/NonD family hydrolase
MSSNLKWLEIHGQKKWANYYRPESREKQAAFFDRFLKDRDTAIQQWPPVRIEVRTSARRLTERAEVEWPLARTRYTPLYLDADSRELRTEQPGAEAQLAYEACDPAGEAVFKHRFDEDTELTGYMKLRLWVEAEGSDDMDLFVAVQKLDLMGQPVGFHFYAFYDNGPVALGWLRVSHRELDENRSTPWQPVHSHLREDRLSPGEIVPVDIEIWPSSSLFTGGETLRLVIKGMDVYRDALPNLPFARHEDLRNRGRHLIHAGGRYDSHLLVPVIPSAGSPPTAA